MKAVSATALKLPTGRPVTCAHAAQRAGPAAPALQGWGTAVSEHQWHLLPPSARPSVCAPTAAAPADPQCTVMQLFGRNDTEVLAQVRPPLPPTAAPPVAPARAAMSWRALSQRAAVSCPASCRAAAARRGCVPACAASLGLHSSGLPLSALWAPTLPSPPPSPSSPGPDHECDDGHGHLCVQRQHQHRQRGGAGAGRVPDHRRQGQEGERAAGWLVGAVHAP